MNSLLTPEVVAERNALVIQAGFLEQRLEALISGQYPNARAEFAQDKKYLTKLLVRAETLWWMTDAEKGDSRWSNISLKKIWKLKSKFEDFEALSGFKDLQVEPTAINTLTYSEDKITALISWHEQLEANMKQLQARLDIRDTEVQELKNSVKKLSDQVDDLAASLVLAQGSIDAVDGGRLVIEKAIADVNGRINEIETVLIATADMEELEVESGKEPG